MEKLVIEGKLGTYEDYDYERWQSFTVVTVNGDDGKQVYYRSAISNFLEKCYNELGLGDGLVRITVEVASRREQTNSF